MFQPCHPLSLPLRLPLPPTREAIKYVRLRQDFHLARVQGRSLQQVFGEDSAVVPGGGGPPAGAGPMRQA